MCFGRSLFQVIALSLLVASAYPCRATAPKLGLLQAASAGDVKEVARLLAAGTDVNQKSPFGTTALHVAAFRGDQGIIDLLLDKGANVNAKDKDGHTADDLARTAGHERVASVLKAAAGP